MGELANWCRVYNCRLYRRCSYHLRPGAITKEMLEEIFPVVKIDKAIVGANVVPKAPGMKYKHYAPKVDMILIEGDNKKMSSSIKEILHKYENERKKSWLTCK